MRPSFGSAAGLALASRREPNTIRHDRLRMNGTRLTHCFTALRSLGGVESYLRRHQTNDAKAGFDSRIVALFEPLGTTTEAVHPIGLNWRDTIDSGRRKFRQHARAPWEGTALYHNAWGLPFLADLDGAERRISMLHSDLPVLAQLLRSQDGLVDGSLCVSEPLKRQALAHCPTLSPERIVVVPCPITVPASRPPQRPLQNRPLVLGFVGRIVREQKRVDRFPILCRHLREAGIDFQFEFLGEGAERAWLERQFATTTNIRFHGRKSGDEYWRILSSWDAIVYVSDYEGMPISLLEAMSMGVLPVHPNIGTGGDAYASRVDSEFAYPPEDFKAVARLFARLRRMPPDEIDRLRACCRQLASVHEGDGYERAFAAFIRQIGEMPRISVNGPTRRGFVWSDYLPFALVHRFYYGALFRRSELSV